MCCDTRPSFFSVHIISQRWQPEQRARSVTIIFVGVVRISTRPEAIDLDVTPHDASTPPTASPATPQPAMASTVRRVKVFCLGSPSGAGAAAAGAASGPFALASRSSEVFWFRLESDIAWCSPSFR